MSKYTILLKHDIEDSNIKVVIDPKEYTYFVSAQVKNYIFQKVYQLEDEHDHIGETTEVMSEALNITKEESVEIAQTILHVIVETLMSMMIDEYQEQEDEYYEG